MLYPLQKKDIKPATAVLADAFQKDPLWLKVFEGESNFMPRYCAFFEMAVRHCWKFGEIYAPTSQLEGIIGWVPGKYADITTWQMLRSGSLFTGLSLGTSVARKLGPLSEVAKRNRGQHLAGRDYLYLLILGVASSRQGQGVGRQLLDAAIAKSEKGKLPLYLETETEQNVNMYQRSGFRLLARISVPLLGLPSWELLREPR